MDEHKHIHQMRLAQRQRYTDLVLSGGGAKGIIYKGCIKELHEQGVLATLQHIHGTSAGALTCALVATGITIPKLEELLDTTDFTKLLGKGFLLNKDGRPMYDLLRKNIRNNIASWLENSDIINKLEQELECLKKQSRQNCTEKLEIKIKNREQKLKALIKIKAKVKQDKSITFRTLRILNKIDPVQFKLLTVNAVDKATGVVQKFNAEQTPDVEIALAARASAALPGILQGTRIKIDGKIRTFIDGGIKENTPLTQRAKVDEESTNKRTLIMMFDYAVTRKALFGSPTRKIANYFFLTRWAINLILILLAGFRLAFSYLIHIEKNMHEVRKQALNAMILNTGNVGTLDFDSANKLSKYLGVKGQLLTRKKLSDYGYLGCESLDGSLDVKLLALSFYENVYSYLTKEQESIFIKYFSDDYYDYDKRSLSLILSNLLLDIKKIDVYHEQHFLSRFVKKLNARTLSYTVKGLFIQLFDPEFIPSQSNVTESVAGYKFTKMQVEAYLGKLMPEDLIEREELEREKEFTALNPNKKLSVYAEAIEDALIAKAVEDNKNQFNGLFFKIVKVLLWPFKFIISLPFKLISYLEMRKWEKKAENIPADELTQPPQQVVYVPDSTQDMDDKCYYIIQKGRIWFKPIAADKKHEWQLLGADGRPPYCNKPLVSLSADGANLVAVDTAGHVHYTKTEKLNFVVSENGWKKTKEGLNWDDAWYRVPVISFFVNLFRGRHLRLPEGTKMYAMSHRGSDTLYTKDISGKKDPGHIGCTSIFTLGANGRIFYADPWLANRFDNEITGPCDGQFVADTMSVSASTHFLLRHSRNGGLPEIYTRTADFDIIGSDPFLSTTYDRDDLTPMVRVMPAENWLKQPTTGLEQAKKLTSKIAVIQTGRGQEQRQLRILAEDQHGNVGYYYKWLYEKAWRFEATPEVTIVDEKDCFLNNDAPMPPAIDLDGINIGIQEHKAIDLITGVKLNKFLKHGLNERGLNTHIVIKLNDEQEIVLPIYACLGVKHLVGADYYKPHWTVFIPKEYRESTNENIQQVLAAMGIKKSSSNIQVKIKESHDKFSDRVDISFGSKFRFCFGATSVNSTASESCVRSPDVANDACSLAFAKAWSTTPVDSAQLSTAYIGPPLGASSTSSTSSTSSSTSSYSSARR